MKKYIDLHIHSTYSDGRYEPKKIIEEAKKANVGVISIADHDTMDAYYDESIKTCDLVVINGVEISSLYTSKKGKNTKVHILGYNLDRSNEQILKLLKEMKDMRTEVNQKYLQAIIKRFPFIPDDIVKIVDTKKYYRLSWAIVEALKELKLDKEDINLVKRHVWNNFPCYDGYDIDYKRVIDTIKSADGIPVIAHPYAYHLNDLEIKRMIRELKDAGIEGIEAYHSECTLENMKRLRMYAESYKLLYSCGSDFHFPTDKDNKIIGHGIEENLCLSESSLTDKILKLEVIKK